MKPHKVKVGGTYHAYLGGENVRVVVLKAIPGYDRGAPHHVYFDVRRENKQEPLKKPLHSGSLYRIPPTPQ